MGGTETGGSISEIPHAKLLLLRYKDRASIVQRNGGHVLFSAQAQAVLELVYNITYA